MSRVDSIQDLGVIDSVPKALLALSVGRLLGGAEGADLEGVEIVDDPVLRGILLWGVDKEYLTLSSGSLGESSLYEGFQRDLQECCDRLDRVDWNDFFQDPENVTMSDDGLLEVKVMPLVGSWVGVDLADIYPSWAVLEMLAIFFMSENSEDAEILVHLTSTKYTGFKDYLILIKKFEDWYKPDNLRFSLDRMNSLSSLRDNSSIILKEVSLLSSENSFYNNIPRVLSEETLPWSEGDAVCVYDFNDLTSRLAVVQGVVGNKLHLKIITIRTAGEGVLSLSQMSKLRQEPFAELRRISVHTRSTYLPFGAIDVGHVKTADRSYLISPISRNDYTTIRFSSEEMESVSSDDVLYPDSVTTFEADTQWGVFHGFELQLIERAAVKTLLNLAGICYNNSSVEMETKTLGGH